MSCQHAQSLSILMQRLGAMCSLTMSRRSAKVPARYKDQGHHGRVRRYLDTAVQSTTFTRRDTAATTLCVWIPRKLLMPPSHVKQVGPFEVGQEQPGKIKSKPRNKNKGMHSTIAPERRGCTANKYVEVPSEMLHIWLHHTDARSDPWSPESALAEDAGLLPGAKSAKSY